MKAIRKFKKLKSKDKKVNKIKLLFVFVFILGIFGFLIKKATCCMLNPWGGIK